MKASITYLKTAVQSFYRPSTYVTVAKDWTGIGLSYVLVMILLAYIPVIGIVSHNMLSFLGEKEGQLSEALEEIVDQIPPMTIENGRLTAELVEQPYAIKSSEATGPLIMIDTRDVAVPNVKQVPVYISSDRIVLTYQGQPYDVFMHELLKMVEQDPNEVVEINRDVVRGWFGLLRQQFPALLMAAYMAEVSARTIEYMFWALVLGMGLSSVLSFMQVNVPFSASVRVAAVAGTPMFALKLVSIASMRPLFAYPDTVYIVLHIVYLFVAAEAIKKAK